MKNYNQILTHFLVFSGWFVILGSMGMFSSCNKAAGIIIPTLQTLSATEITGSAATLNGRVMDDGGGKKIYRGFIYATFPDLTIDDNKVDCGTGTGDFQTELSGLQPFTTYYFRAYAYNEAGVAYGEVMSFETSGP